MPPDPTSSPAATDLAGYLGQHLHVALWLSLLCLWVSLCLIARLWLVHRQASLARKLFWSAALLLPFLGWFFFVAFFRRLGSSDSPAHVEHARHAEGAEPGPNSVFP